MGWKVLILVVMEDGLVLPQRLLLLLWLMSLNPCCDGRWSRTILFLVVSTFSEKSLNPCCDGRWSRTTQLMNWEDIRTKVLILVVMEDGLVPVTQQWVRVRWLSLNPCCDGRWSRTRPYKTILIINKLKNSTKQFFTFLNRKLTFP